MPTCYVGRLMSFVPDRAGFLELARHGRLAFVYLELLADTDTPVSAYAKLGRGPYSFLLESVVGGDKWAAYSFVGVRPRAVVRARGGSVEVLAPEDGGFRVVERANVQDPLRFLDDYLAKLAPAVPPGLPRFFGGAVGWLGYDIARSFERLPDKNPDDLGVPELCFAITDTVVIFDNLRGTVKVVAAVDVERSGACRSRAGLRRRLRAHRGDPGSPDAAGAAAAGARSDAARVAARAARDGHAAAVRGRRGPDPGVRPGRRRLPGRLLAAVRGPPRRRRSVRRLPGAAGDKPVALHVPPGVPRGGGDGRLPGGAGAARRGRGRGAADRRHAAARRDPRGGRGPGGGAARRSEGARRAHDADRSRAQRRRPRVGPGQRHAARSNGDRALLSRHAPGLQRARARAPGNPPVGRGARLLPRRDPERRAQDSRHGDHRGAGALAPRDLRRRRRVRVVHGQHGSLDRDPHPGHHRGQDHPPGGGRDRRRQRPRRGVQGVPQQGGRGGERRRDRASRVGGVRAAVGKTGAR